MADLETRQVNSLYKRINNEAVDEDKQANRRAVEFSKKQAKLFSPDVKQASVLGKKDLQNLKLLISKFSTTLNKFTSGLGRVNNKEQVRDISNIQGQYDILSLFLNSINLVSLDKQDYDTVIGELDPLIPKIQEVRLAVEGLEGVDDVNFPRRVMIHILYNFMDHSYAPFKTYTNADVLEVARYVGNQRVQAARNEIDALQENEDPEEQELPGEQRQLPIGVAIPDQDILDELEQDKETLNEIYEDISDFRNVADDVTIRSINIRLQSIEQNINLIDNVLNGRNVATQDLVNHITASIRYYRQTQNYLHLRYQ
jgi:hypothetical protein